MAEQPMSDEALIKLAGEMGAQHGGDSEDELEGDDDGELADIADDAWYNSGWMEFENHPELEDWDGLSEANDRLKLESIYKKAFVAAFKSR